MIWHRSVPRPNGGYFYLPCPNCGEMFSGAEWRSIDGHADSIPVPGESSVTEHGSYVGKGKGICPTCVRDGVGDRAWAAIGRGLLHDEGAGL